MQAIANLVGCMGGIVNLIPSGVQRFLNDLGSDVSVAQPTSMNGYNMTLIVTPTVKK